MGCVYQKVKMIRKGQLPGQLMYRLFPIAFGVFHRRIVSGAVGVY